MSVYDYDIAMSKSILKTIKQMKGRKALNPPLVDPWEFGTMTKLVLLCGAKRREIPKILCGDVLNQKGQIQNQIQTNSDPMPIPENIRRELRLYLKKQKDKASSSVSPNKPLFPTYGYPDKVNEHFKIFLNGRTYSEIRQSGIRYTYYSVWKFQKPKRDTYRTDEGVLKAASQFRLSKQEIFGILIGVIQPTGKKKRSPFPPDFIVPEGYTKEQIARDEDLWKKLIREHIAKKGKEPD